MNKVVFVNTKENKIEVKDIDFNLETYYKMIDCDCIDIVERRIGDMYFDIICDDEGFLKEDYTISGISMQKNLYGNNDIMVGNLIICSNDNEGNEIGLTDAEVEEIMENVITYNGVNFIEYDF